MVRRDKRGRWRYRTVITLPDGRKIRISGSAPSSINTREAAKRAERAHVERTLNPPPPPRKEVPTFGNFVDQRWWPVDPAARKNRPTTRREKEIHLRVHLKPAFESVPLDQIEGEVADRFFAKLSKDGLSAKSMKNIRATLRRILACAARWKVIPAVPDLPDVKVPDPKWDFYLPDESENLVAATRSPEERAVLLFALRTGARAGEQIALECGDLDWHNRQVIFRRSSTRGEVGPTKSGKERKVPMTAALEKALRAIKHLRGPLVFCNHDGRPMTLWQLHERLWGAARRAGLRRIRWNDLRHTFASQLVMAGVPLRQVQDWMGHSTITMTMRYSHLAPGSGADLIRALDGAGVATTSQKAGDGEGGG